VYSIQPTYGDPLGLFEALYKFLYAEKHVAMDLWNKLMFCMMQHVIFARTEIKSDLSRYNWPCGVIRFNFNSVHARGDHFRFGSFLSKNSNQTEIKKKTETGSNRPVSVRFSSVFLGQKPVQTVLAWFFRFGSVFFQVFFCSVRFGLVFSKF
jgi:hypothetical protein